MEFAGLAGPFAAFLSSLTWAVGITTYASLAKKHSPTSINFTRALFALPLFVFLVLLLQGGLSGAFEAFSNVHREQVGWFAVSMISSYVLADVIFILSTRALGVPTALAIASTYPIWSALAGWVFKGESLSLLRWVGLVIVVASTVIVILVGHSQRPLKADPKNKNLDSYATGLILAFVASLFWSMNTYAVARGGEGHSIGVGNSIRMALALLLCPIVGAFQCWPPRVPKSAMEWVVPWKELRPVILIFIFEGFGGSFCFLYGLTHSSLAVGAALSALAPVLSAPIAWIRKDEVFLIKKFLGILGVVFGVWLLVGMK